MARTLVQPEQTKDQLDGTRTEFQAHVIELHQPVEQMGNQRTLSTQNSEMVRLSNGDWLVRSKKTKQEFLVGAGNVKAVKLKPASK